MQCNSGWLDCERYIFNVSKLSLISIVVQVTITGYVFFLSFVLSSRKALKETHERDIVSICLHV
jgi:hypothetical protein